MAKGATHVLGLDIGSKTIKAVEVRKTGQGFEMVGRPVIAPVPPRSVDAGVVVDPSAVTEALSALVAAGHFGTKKAITSVGGDTSVVVRITEVPKMTGKELEQAVQFELDRQTPFPVDQVIYDYQPIERPDADPNAPNMEVLLAVAQEDMVNGHVEALMGAKLTPIHVDIEGLATARALIDSAGDSYADQTVAIVSIGATGTAIVIVRRKLLAFVRTIPTAGNTLTTAVRQNFAGDDEQAERFKVLFADLGDGYYAGPAAAPAHSDGGVFDDTLGGSDSSHGGHDDSVFELSDSHPPEAGSLDEGVDGATRLDFEPPTAFQPPAAEAHPAAGQGHTDEPPDVRYAREVVYEAISSALVDLATEIRRSLDFYRRQHRNENIDRIILAGGTATLRGLAGFIAGETGIATELANPFAHLIVHGDVAPAEYLANIGPMCVNAVGLALRDMID